MRRHVPRVGPSAFADNQLISLPIDQAAVFVSVHRSTRRFAERRIDPRPPAAKKVANDRAALAFVRVDHHPARRGRPAVADQVAIMSGALFILDDQVGKFADRARTETEEDRSVVVGKALKVTVHPPLADGSGERILGAREMIEADGLIPRGNEALISTLGLFEAQFMIGQIAGVDPTLARGIMSGRCA